MSIDVLHVLDEDLSSILSGQDIVAVEWAGKRNVGSMVAVVSQVLGLDVDDATVLDGCDHSTVSEALVPVNATTVTGLSSWTLVEAPSFSALVWHW